MFLRNKVEGNLIFAQPDITLRCSFLFALTQVSVQYAAGESDKTPNLLLFLPLCSSLSLTGHFFQLTQSVWWERSRKKATIAFCVELLRHVTSCPASPAPVRFTQIHLKESRFHAWCENSFLTLITLLLPLRTKCSQLKLISQQGLLSKNSDVPSYHLWSVGLRENLLWINCKYHLPNFYLDISLMLT